MFSFINVSLVWPPIPVAELACYSNLVTSTSRHLTLTIALPLHLLNRGTTPLLRKLSQEKVNFHFINEFLTTSADHLNVWNYQLKDMERDFLSL